MAQDFLDGGDFQKNGECARTQQVELGLISTGGHDRAFQFGNGAEMETDWEC